jgi:O-acetylhomoserine (thiol)-lyase
MAVQIFPSMIETTPSVVYSELYNTTNRFLDESAYRIANYLNKLGYRAHFFPRDCYGDISVLVKKPEAAFSHVIAAKYAGLGTIGMNHTLLTKEFGPRVRLVSVITDAEITPDKMLEKELCIRCKMCAKKCPQQAFTPRDDRIVADMDKHKCALYHQQLKGEFRYPCGVCTAVCPVGEDKKLYGKSSVSPEGVEHCRNFGSKNAVENIPDDDENMTAFPT